MRVMKPNHSARSKSRAERSPKEKGKRSNRAAQSSKAAAGEDEPIVEDSRARTKATTSFPVVGVGASAGGLEAFTNLLRSLPAQTGMAFVLIPHLDPTHESAMTELLGRTTRMPVLQVYDGIRIKVDHVYVIPPNRDMTIFDGALRLVTRAHDGPHMPIDTFFRSLASAVRSNAIGVILSGTASDGTLGVAAIKSEGGITFAQDSRSAKYDGMPNSAVASGNIDMVLPPAGIGQDLMRIPDHAYRTHPSSEVPGPIEGDSSQQMTQIFRLLKQACKVDFSDYKPATIRRRIMRRMALRRVANLGDYVRNLQQDRKELEALYNDILINVTNFFRDADVFETLRKTLYPAILKGRPATETVRIWVPGCSTGEEAYSHAIALMEYVTEIRAGVSVQVFATDLSASAVCKARAGIYRESIKAEVSPTRLKRFFIKVEGGYQISKAVRDVCIFANQNVLSDPPFSHIDIVSCRNVLIYLSQALQRRVIPIFHYALRPRGYLIIGNTEGLVGTGAELFEPIHKRHKIYRKKSVPSPVAFGIPPEHLDSNSSLAQTRPAVIPAEVARTPIELQREADRLLLSRYAPASVVVGPDLDVLQTRGEASRYLELPTGRASLNLLKMIKPGLLFQVQETIEEAKKKGGAIRRENLQAESDGTYTNLNIEAIPFGTPGNADHNVLLVFEDSKAAQARAAEPLPPLPAPAKVKDRLLNQLRQELTATKEYQQSIIEALEASNEELQSANEEIQSGNEELQSTNEELQTSKEELESANEELNTVNEEMQHRNYQLAQVNNDLTNLLASVNGAIVMLSSDFTVRRFTPRAEELLGLSGTDVGRPLVHLRLKLPVPDFEHLTIKVMRDGSVRQRDFEHDGKVYRVRVNPYRTSEGSIEGVVAVILDMADFQKPVAAKQSKKRRS
jgi:two-component system, chemotaxis family, CheB/CheR fusion protein